jgi:hypothetical protein
MHARAGLQQESRSRGERRPAEQSAQPPKRRAGVHAARADLGPAGGEDAHAASVPERGCRRTLDHVPNLRRDRVTIARQALRSVRVLRIAGTTSTGASRVLTVPVR